MRYAKQLAPILSLKLESFAKEVGGEYEFESSPIFNVWLAGQVIFGDMSGPDLLYYPGMELTPPTTLSKEGRERLILTISKLKPFALQQETMAAVHKPIKKWLPATSLRKSV